MIRILSENEWGYLQFKFKMGDVIYDGISMVDGEDDEFFIYIGDLEDIKAKVIWRHSDELKWSEQSFLVKMLEEMLIES